LTRQPKLKGNRGKRLIEEGKKMRLELFRSLKTTQPKNLKSMRSLSRISSKLSVN
jgi:hypothetical protein